MNKTLIKSALIASVLGFAPLASAQLAAMDDAEMRSINGQGFVLEVGNALFGGGPLLSLAIPEVSDLNLVVGNIPVSAMVGNFKTNHPTLILSVSTQFTSVMNNLILPPINGLVAGIPLVGGMVAPIVLVHAP